MLSTVLSVALPRQKHDTASELSDVTEKPEKSSLFIKDLELSYLEIKNRYL